MTELDGAVPRLMADLHDARAAFETDQRSGCIAALGATIAFLDVLTTIARQQGAPVSVSLTEPLVRLAGAMNSLEAGTVEPLLQAAPQKRGAGWQQGNRPPLATNVEVGRAVAAAAMECLIMAGMQRKEAARHAAKLLVRSPLISEDRSNGARPERRIARWRDNLRAADRTSSDSPAAGAYHAITREAVARKERDGWEAAELIAFAEAQLQHGVGMGGGAPHSELVRAQAERS